MRRINKIWTNYKKQPFHLLGYLSFAILFVLSAYFYKERILFADSAFQFFKTVNFEKINIEASRYGAVLPQLPVLFAMKLGVGLKWLTIIYSGSFILLYFLVFICCVYFLKNISAGLSIVFVLIVCISQSFFHPVTETHQSLVYSVLVFAILEYSGFRSYLVHYFLAIAAILLSFFSHPVAIYPLVFIIGYVAIDKKQLRSFAPYFLLIILAALAVGKVLLTNENSYEGKFFTELLKSPSLIFDLPHSFSTKFFIKRMFGLYSAVVIFELFFIIFFISKKEYLKLVWQLVSSGFFMIITLLTYNQGDSDVMMERAFMPLAVFVVVPFLKEIIGGNSKFKVITIVFLSVVILISSNRVFQQGRKFKERTQFNQELLLRTARLPNRKFIVEFSDMEKHYNTFWSQSFESLILSSITKDIPVQTLFPANNPEGLKKYTEGAANIFLGADFWLEWSIDNLNHNYFNLSTELPYAFIKIDEL